MELNDTKTWWFSKKIEDMPREELEGRLAEVMKLDLKKIIVPMPYLGNPGEVVHYRTDELIALCPATGYPDLYGLDIEYSPKHSMPELKSLKFYLMQYLNLPIPHEHLASKIFNDFNEVLSPKYAIVRLTVASRGGIVTEIEVGSDML